MVVSGFHEKKKGIHPVLPPQPQSLPDLGYHHYNDDGGVAPTWLEVVHVHGDGKPPLPLPATAAAAAATSVTSSEFVELSSDSSSKSKEPRTRRGSSSGSGNELPRKPPLLDTIKKQKRMLSNRESARRSRMRKQQHLDEVRAQVAQLRAENDHMMQSYNEALKRFAQFTEQNQVLHAHATELKHRLQYLHQILMSLDLGQHLNSSHFEPFIDTQAFNPFSDNTRAPLPTMMFS